MKYSGVSQLFNRKPLYNPCFRKSIKLITHVTHARAVTAVFALRLSEQTITDWQVKAATQLSSEKIYFVITSDGTSVFTVCYSVSDSSDRVWGCPVTVGHHQRGGIHDTVWVIRETEEWMFLLWHINNTERVSKTEGGLESCLHSQLC